MPLAPPEPGLYVSWVECERAIQLHAAREGYAIRPHPKVKSKKTGQYARYVVRCDKSGVWRSKVPEEQRRKKSKKTGCPFSATVNVRDDGSGCILRVHCPDHNHPPSASPSAHIQHRRLTEQQRRLIEAGATAKKPYKAVYDDLLRAYPDTYAKAEDVANYIQAWKRRARDHATGVQALLYRLQDREDIWSFPLERGGGLVGMFWLPKWCQDLWSREPDILVMQTAHIADRPAVLPVLEMSSVVAFGSRVGPGYAVLPDKNDPTLLWLLQAVERLRQRIKVPKPAFVTVTDFQTAEKNVIAEVHKSGPQHRQTHIVFGRVLDRGDDGPETGDGNDNGNGNDLTPPDVQEPGPSGSQQFFGDGGAAAATGGDMNDDLYSESDDISSTE